MLVMEPLIQVVAVVVFAIAVKRAERVDQV
jgi:hypothetical protein